MTRRGKLLRHPGRKCSGRQLIYSERAGTELLLLTCNACLFQVFSGKFANKIIWFSNPEILLSNPFVRMHTEMNPSVSEIRRKQMPEFFKKETEWFAKGFNQPRLCNQPKTRLEISASTIDEFQTMIWDKLGRW